MTVGFFRRMQKATNSKAKKNASKQQRSKQQTSATALDSNRSMSYLPANQGAPSGSEEEQSTDDGAATTPTTIQNESMAERMEDSAEEMKQSCLVIDATLSASAGESDPESPVSAGISATRVSQWDADISAMPSGIRPPPPSVVSVPSSLQYKQPTDTSKIQCCKSVKLVDRSVPADKVCVHISDNVPVPSKTDAIARVCREVLNHSACSLKDDDDSDVFASGEEWEEEKKSEYSTADEDCESQHQKKVQKKAQIEKQLGINEDEDNSTEDGNSFDIDLTDSARTDANVKRDPCGPTFAILGANSEALRPVLVRQVSQDEDVRVTSDDDDNDRLDQTTYIFESRQDPLYRGEDVNDTQDDRDEPIIPMQHIDSGPFYSSHDMATSPIQGEMVRQVPLEEGKCDDATEPIRWSEVQSMESVVTVREKKSIRSIETKRPGMERKEPSEEIVVSGSNSRWRSTEPYVNTRAVCVSSSSQEIRQPSSMYPTLCRAGRYSMPMPSLHSKSPQQQMKERRVRQTLVDALAVCEEELGPLAVSLAKLQEKVRSMNLPEMNRLRQSTATPICGQSNNYLALDPSMNSITRGDKRRSVPTVAADRPCTPSKEQFAGSRSDMVARLSHNVDCLCRYCGLKVGTDVNLSPVARMYILLAQPHRKSCEEGENRQRDARRM